MADNKTVMIVDDNMTNLKMGKNALGDLYNVITVPSGERMFEIFDHITPHLILLDVEMPEMNGFEVIKRLKADDALKEIPVIFLTAKNEPQSELEGLSLGAVDYISKPFSAPVLRKRVENHLLLKRYNDNLVEMVQEKTSEIAELQNAVMSTMAEIVEYRDLVTGQHIERTKRYLKVLVEGMLKAGLHGDELSEWNLDLLVESAALHDVGKIHIPDAILIKPGRLTDGEFATMKKHTIYGVQIIKMIQKKTRSSKYLQHAEIFAGTHHERWDGKGYPFSLAGEEIPLQGRLMAIADVFDALSCDRPYKKAMSFETSIGIIAEGRGFHFDPEVTDVFLSLSETIDRIGQEFSK